VYVVLGHAWFTVWPEVMYREKPSGLVLALTSWLRYGHAAVAFFIVLSGYVLGMQVVRSGNLIKGSAWSFYKKRAWRILPPYYFALIISLLLLTWIRYPSHTLYDGSLPVTTQGILSHFLLIHNFWTKTRAEISGPFWSIAVECQIYLAFPLMVWVAQRRGWLVALGTVVLAALPSWFLLRKTDHYDLMPLLYVCFGFGTLAAAATHDPALQKVRDLPWKWISSTAFGLFVLYTVRAGTEALIHVSLGEILFGIGAAGGVILMANNPNGWVVQRLSSRPLVAIGTFSYSLYLIHSPLQQLFWQFVLDPLHLPKPATFGLLAFAGTPLLVAAAYGFHLLFERPFMSQRQRLAEREAIHAMPSKSPSRSLQKAYADVPHQEAPTLLRHGSTVETANHQELSLRDIETESPYLG